MVSVAKTLITFHSQMISDVYIAQNIKLMLLVCYDLKVLDVV